MYSQTGHRRQYGACALHAGYLGLQKHTKNEKYFLLIHGNNGTAIALQCYVIVIVIVIVWLVVWWCSKFCVCVCVRALVCVRACLYVRTHARIYVCMGTAVAQWLRFCTTHRKVAGSIPDGVIGFFRWHNSSDHTMALGSTQSLTEMSTRSISWG
jgi:hypothetical protein